MINLRQTKEVKEIFDELFERYEDVEGEKITCEKLANKLHRDKSTINKMLNGKVGLKSDDILILADIFKVSTDVILGRTSLSEMKSDNNVSVKGLSECSKQWINNNSEKDNNRIEMLNILLSHYHVADLFFDTLIMYSLGLDISMSNYHEFVSRECVEQQLLEKNVLSKLYEVYWFIFKYTSNTREQRLNKEVAEITDRLWESYEACKQSRLNEEEEELKYELEELKSGKEDMYNDNINLSTSWNI